MDRSHPSPWAQEKPMRRQAREKNLFTRLRVNTATKSCHNYSSAWAFPARAFVNQTVLQATAFGSSRQCSSRRPHLAWIRTIGGLLTNGCNAHQAVVSPRANAAHAKRARPAQWRLARIGHKPTGRGKGWISWHSSSCMAFFVLENTQGL